MLVLENTGSGAYPILFAQKQRHAAAAAAAAADDDDDDEDDDEMMMMMMMMMMSWSKNFIPVSSTLSWQYPH